MSIINIEVRPYRRVVSQANTTELSAALHKREVCEDAVPRPIADTTDLTHARHTPTTAHVVHAN